MSDSVSRELLEAERKKEEESKKSRLSVTRRKSALVAPEEQARIVTSLCQQFKGIVGDKDTIPTIEEVISHLEAAEGIKQDPKHRSVSVPRHSDSTLIEQAVYAAVLVLMASNASSLVSPRGGEPQELFALATALIASNAGIAQEQIATVLDTLKAGKASLTPEAQADLDTSIAILELSSALITQAKAQGKSLSEQDRRQELLEAIAKSDKFPDPESRKKAEEVIKKCDASFSKAKAELAKPRMASSAASLSASVEEPRAAALSTSKPVEEKTEARAPVGGAPSSPTEIKGKEKAAVRTKARPVRSASVGGRPAGAELHLPPFLPPATVRRLSSASGLGSSAVATVPPHEGDTPRPK